MLKFDSNQFIAEDGTPIFYYTTPRHITTKGIVIIVHGMSEYALRYQSFADFLYRKGYIVYAHDQRGHGLTGQFTNTFGYFGDKDGWNTVINDVRQLCEIAKNENPDLPLFLFGHSMGSIVARHCIIDFGNIFSGVVISGTTLGTNSLVRAFGRGIALSEIVLNRSKQHPSKLLTELSFGSYAKKIKNAQTKFDWLTPEKEIVKDYLNDPLCGFTCSDQFFIDFFKGFDYTNKQANINKMPKSLPVLFISGQDDPVGNFGKDIKKIVKRFKKAEMKKITVRIYPGFRHEVINDKSSQPIRKTVAAFYSEQLK